MFNDAAYEQPATLGTEAPALAIGNKCFLNWTFLEISPLIPLIICVFNLIIIHLFVSEKYGLFLAGAMLASRRASLYLLRQQHLDGTLPLILRVRLLATLAAARSQKALSVRLSKQRLSAASACACVGTKRAGWSLQWWAVISDNGPFSLIPNYSNASGPFCWEFILWKDVLTMSSSSCPSFFPSLCAINLDAALWCILI